MELPPCRIVTWKDVERWSDIIAEKIVDAGSLPGTIVGLTRGGWIPARLLADRLGVKHMVALRAQHWGVTATPTGDAQITEGLAKPLNGQKVVVVDDITDTGQSLSLAVRHVTDGKPERVESAALLHITHSSYIPTYYGEEISKEAWRWFIFPWNYWEDLNTLALKALPEGKDEHGVKRLLREHSGIHVEERDIRLAIKSKH